MLVRRWFWVVVGFGLLVSLVGALLVAGVESGEAGVPLEPVGEVPDGFGVGDAVLPPPGTPFDDFEAPAEPALKAPEEWELVQARQLRSDLGFDTSEEVIGDSFAVSVADAGSVEALSRQAFGVPLDVVEFAEMQRRQSMLEDQVDVGTRAEALDGFAGVFIDQPAGGVLVLRFTAKADASAVEALVDGYRFGEFLRVETVEWSLAELIAIRDEAIEKMLASGRVEGREWLAEVDIRANETVLRHVDEVQVLAEEVARSTGARAEVFAGLAEGGSPEPP